LLVLNDTKVFPARLRGVKASGGRVEVLLIEQSAAALALARGNLARLGAAPNIRLLAGDATRLGPARSAYDLIFLDPPYRSGLATPTLAALREGWLAEGARIVVELAAMDELPPSAGYALEQERRYGAARFVFLRPAA